MSSSLSHAQIAFTEEGPLSLQYQDRYHGRLGAYLQARKVFIAGNALESRWAHAEALTILETGFGLGFNFLATWAVWRESATRAPLHFVSIEAHPIDLLTLARAHAGEPELMILARELRDQWPDPRPGVHRLAFEGGQVKLTLVFGEDIEALSRIACAADCLYLDGFAPDKNPKLWSVDCMRALFDRAKPGATLATWCAAAHVRRHLELAGFRVEIGPGLGTKRETTRAEKPGAKHSPPPPTDITVLGAGLAGTGLALKARERGLAVRLIDAAPEAGSGASGNPAGVIRPTFGSRPSRQEAMTWSAFQYAVRDLQTDRACFTPSGVMHLASSLEEEVLWRERILSEGLSSASIQALSARDLQRLSGLPLDRGGLFFPGGGWVRPKALCLARQRRFDASIECLWSTQVHAFHPGQTDWRLETSRGEIVGDHPLIIANGAGFGHAEGPDFRGEGERPLIRQRGEITSFAYAFDQVMSGEGYLTPHTPGEITVGATYDRVPDAALTQEGRAENEARFRRLTGLTSDLPVTGGRASWRSIAGDRLPIVGQDPTHAYLWHCRAFASRGLVWHALAAELLLDLLLRSPWPLDKDLGALLSPDRPGLKRRAIRPA